MLPDQLRLLPAADFHVHLRQGKMMELVTPKIRDGGVDLVYVMPNLNPPITTVASALAYQKELQALAPDVEFLMTLYLHPSVTPKVIAEAAKADIVGVKLYPAGVTTGSETGVSDLKGYWPVFQAMQQHDMVLNLHGEAIAASSNPKDGKEAITVLNAEKRFLPTLHELHAAFPRLRIVLEHATTKEAIEAVEACGPTVGGTITAHHLFLTIDEWANDPFCYCKPVAKTPEDRTALLRAVVKKEGRFFLGSDSAPHPVEAKKGTGRTAAGCFTQPYVIALVVDALEEAVKTGHIEDDALTVERLNDFCSARGRRFYGIPPHNDEDHTRILLEVKGEKVSLRLSTEDEAIEIVPFRLGELIRSLTWVQQSDVDEKKNDNGATQMRC